MTRQGENFFVCKMIQLTDTATVDLFGLPLYGRNRPRLVSALAPAQRQEARRKRLKQSGKGSLVELFVDVRCACRTR